MGFLQLPSLPEFKKAVISFWFRIPQESLNAMAAASNAFTGTVRPRMLGVLPLVTFGPSDLEGYRLETQFSGNDASYNEILWHTPLGGAWAVLTTVAHTYSSHSFFVHTGTTELNSSYIGIVSSNDAGKYELHVHLQTMEKGNITGVSGTTTNSISDKNTGAPTGAALGLYPETHWDYSLDAYITRDVAPDNPQIEAQTTVDTSTKWIEQNGPDSFDFGYGIIVEPDTWHHVIISFDLSNTTTTRGTMVEGLAGDFSGSRGTTTITQQASISEPCMAWIALDDENQTDGAINTIGGELRPNEMLSRYTEAAYVGQGGSYYSRAWDVTGCVLEAHNINENNPRATYNGSGLPEGSLGIPAQMELSNNIQRVEMAELQMWIGSTLDTSVESNRRAFIDMKKDALGRPVPNKDGIIGWMPVNPKVAAELVGQKQDVQLTTTKNWQQGKNTGLVGTLFSPIGTIVRYPDPIIPF